MYVSYRLLGYEKANALTARDRFLPLSQYRRWKIKCHLHTTIVKFLCTGRVVTTFWLSPAVH